MGKKRRINGFRDNSSAAQCTVLIVMGSLPVLGANRARCSKLD